MVMEWIFFIYIFFKVKKNTSIEIEVFKMDESKLFLFLWESEILSVNFWIQLNF